ncbi:MAG TPA: outer membrane lipoprotein chaperone LolA [Terracidiphilus sp.]|jgi:outer membrane lipoprotein carrier protein|nr:outer membrane lipoprotein chaperone LolA [Terracidiphilus sp.]
MTRRALALAVLLTSTLLAAQTPSVHELAQRVDDHYNRLHSLKAGFTETYEGMGMSRTESGTLYLRKPGRMRWDYSKPAGKLFLLDGKYAWSYTKGDAQVQRIPAKEVDDLRSPLRFLLGHTKLEKELTDLTMKPDSHGEFTLTGKVKGQEKRIDHISLTVTTEGEIGTIVIEEADGATTSFFFTNQQTNAAIPEVLFHFKAPKGVPVVNGLPPV